MRPSRTPIVCRIPAVFALAAALMSVACKAPEARLGTEIDAHGDYADPSRFRMILTEGGVSRAIDLTSMHVDALAPGHFSASREGIVLSPGTPATVEALVETSSGIVRGRVEWTPQEDWEYGVTAFVDSMPPLGFCFHVAQAVPLPVGSGATPDTLYMLHYGVGKGAIC